MHLGFCSFAGLNPKWIVDRSQDLSLGHSKKKKIQFIIHHVRLHGLFILFLQPPPILVTRLLYIFFSMPGHPFWPYAMVLKK